MSRLSRRLTGALATAASLTLASALAVTVVSPADAESNGGVRVMPLGDSITDGLTVPGGYRISLWQRLIAGGFRVDFVGSLVNGPASLGDHDHEGHSGWRIDQIDANIVPWLQATTPRTILLHIGTNDMVQNPNGAPQRLSTLIDHITATAPNTDVFVATIIPLSGRDQLVQTFNAAIPGIVQSKIDAGRHVHLVNMFPALTTADLADGVHPNAGGYTKMANVWFNALQSVPGSIGNGTPSGSPPAPSSPPSSSPAPSSPVPSSPAPSANPGSGCTATYRLVNNWSTGFQAEVAVRNTGSSALTGWTVRLTLPAGQSINNLWDGVNTGTSGAVSVRNAPYNGTLAVAGGTTFGYVGNGNGAATPPGLTCTGA